MAISEHTDSIRTYDRLPVVPTHVTKRNGRVVPFDAERVTWALQRCFGALGREPQTGFDDLTRRVVNIVSVKANGATPSVEGIQDAVELVLQAAGEFEAAKRYILYREEHAQKRQARPIPAEVQAAFDSAAVYFPTPLQQFQYVDKYAMFNDTLGRRETWVETVDRAVGFLHELAGDRVEAAEYEWLRRMILEMKAMPSMRLLAMAGPAARRQNLSIYNCSYLPVIDIDCWVEALTISMAGCGVGFSVESQYVERFPRIKRQRRAEPRPWVVEDSAEGWADALRFGIQTWFEGGDVVFDTSLVRPAGARLKTKGGRASGPGPLREMLNFIRARILARQGTFLRPIDAHDIMCAVGQAAVSGGVRRTAMISLFDIDDVEMRECKTGDNLTGNEQRWNANNSAVWVEDPDDATLMELFLDTIKSKRGEPGIFSRAAVNRARLPWRKKHDFGVNPCGEIPLRKFGLCNLSIAVAREYDTETSLQEKVRAATLLGTIQSLATHFPGMRPEWKQNAEEERLTGVDLTGQMDSPITWDAGVLDRLSTMAVDYNGQLAQRFGINRSATVTCNKPSGNSSTLLNTSSGIHRRHSKAYVRNVRVGTHAPQYKVMKDAGVPMSPENGEMPETAKTWVAHFPVIVPEGAQTREGVSAIEQCETWLRNARHWCKGNSPSCTVTYRPGEEIELLKWIADHRSELRGLSLMPEDDAQYDNLPYETRPIEEVELLAKQFPVINWAKIWQYETEDETKAAQELACVAGNCDV